MLLVGLTKVDTPHDPKHNRQICRGTAPAAGGQETVPLLGERTSVGDLTSRGVCVEDLLSK